ncbi:hypothetical protein DXG01_013374 [Tephrocybe rancida]|nr:hypothetical protein DXG01_013374 [Tephrocybe rancida]
MDLLDFATFNLEPAGTPSSPTPTIATGISHSSAIVSPPPSSLSMSPGVSSTPTTNTATTSAPKGSSTAPEPASTPHTPAPYPTTQSNTTSTTPEVSIGISMATTTPPTTSSSSTNTNSTTNPTKEYPSPTLSLKGSKTTGAIVGGVLGSVLGLAGVVAVLFFCRRKRRNASELNLLHMTRDPTASPSPSLHNEWLAKVDAAMSEAAKETERARSRTESRLRGSDLGHYSASGFQSPDTMTEKTQYGPQSRVLSPISPPVPAIYRGEEHLEVTGYPETNRRVESESEESGAPIQLKSGEGPWDEYVEDLTSTRTPSQDSHITDDTEERERRREELFAQMRRVLDNDSINRVDEDSEESGFYRPTGSVEEI